MDHSSQQQHSAAKFCASCGTKREAQAAFCHQCGASFGATSSARNEWVAMVLFVVLGTLASYFFIDRVYQTPGTHAADDHAGHDHGHQPHDNQRMKDLKAAAESGNAADLMNLAEYQIEKGIDEPEYFWQATQSLEKIVALYPKHAYSLRLLGNIYFQLRQPEESTKYYLRYLEQVPQDANALTDLGTQYLALEQVDKAISTYDQALKLYPDLYHAQFNLSVAFEHLGDEAKAAEARDKANALERRVGKQLAPVPEVPRLPEGVAAVSETTAAAGTVQDQSSFGGLKAYFANHPIVGPKMVSFEQAQNEAVLTLANFPMEQMPPFAREAFDTKVRQQLAQVEGAQLTIRDAQSGKVLATYE